MVGRPGLRLLPFTSVLAGLAGAASAAGTEVAKGRWLTPSRHGIVEISACGNSICGRLVQSDGLRANPDLRDVKNKDAALRSRRLRDLAILGGFTRDGDKWTGGRIYNPEDGGTYSAAITMATDGTLHLKGCVVWPLCKTQSWKHVP